MGRSDIQCSITVTDEENAQLIKIPFNKMHITIDSIIEQVNVSFLYGNNPVYNIETPVVTAIVKLFDMLCSNYQDEDPDVSKVLDRVKYDILQRISYIQEKKELHISLINYVDILNVFSDTGQAKQNVECTEDE